MKDFLEEYGFAILAAIVVILLITFTTPVGNAVQKSIVSTIEQTTARTDNKMKIINNADDVDSIQESWTDDYIEFHKTQQNVSFDEYKKHLVKVNFNQWADYFKIRSYLNDYGWSSDNHKAKFEIIEDTIKIINDNTKGQANAFMYTYKSSPGHKFLITADIKASNNMVSGVFYDNNQKFLSMNIENFTRVSMICLTKTSYMDLKGRLYIYVNYNENDENYNQYVIAKNIMLIDLTSMFGEGNEPETLEQFKEVFPKDYYDYNEGTEMMVYVPWMEA